MSMQKPKGTFYEAFSPSIGCYHAFCACGREFVTSHEHESEKASKKATHLDHSLGYIEFEGVTYVYDCTCWHERANRIQEFIDGHFEEIAIYMNGEIKRKKEEASRLIAINIYS